MSSRRDDMDEQFDDDLDGAHDCHCQKAVQRAFVGMLASGAPRSVALEAATRVFLYHHPDVPAAEAHGTVEHWVFTGPLH